MNAELDQCIRLLAELLGVEEDTPTREAHDPAAERAAFVEEVEFLLSCGESPASVPARLGYTNSASMERRLHRAERHDLAALIRGRQTPDRLAAARRRNAAKRQPCLAGCGGTCGHWSKHQICHGCMNRYGLARALAVVGDVQAAMAMSTRAEREAS